MLAKNTDPENRKNESCIQGVKSIILQMFQIVPCVIANLSWKFQKIHSPILP